MIERTTIRFEHELLAGVEPCFEAAGRHDGPHVSLIGGIHGGEYSSIAAVIRVMRTLDASELRGRITAVPGPFGGASPTLYAVLKIKK